MSPARPAPHNLQGLPTLTEVIEMPGLERAPGVAELPPVGEADLVVRNDEPSIDEEQLVARVLVDLQRHAELMLEYRLREAITPALSRLSEALVRELRLELAATLRDVVARSVSQELARQRGR